MYLKVSRSDIAEYLGIDPSMWKVVDDYRTRQSDLYKIDHDNCGCSMCERGHGDPDYGLYLWLNEDWPDADELYNFELYGLGRVNQNAWEYAVRNDICRQDDYCGGTTDRQHMFYLVQLQDSYFCDLIDQGKVTEVYWY